MIFLLLVAAELTGYISDAACGWNNAREGKEAKECARKCVDAGWDPVFVQDGGMNAYKIPQKALANPLVGEHVAITGEIKGDTLNIKAIRKVAPAAKPAPKK